MFTQKAAFALALGLLGCTGTIPEGRFACATESECPDGWVCGADQRCYSGSGARCANDGECADGLFCNGGERCDPPASDADARGCVAGSAVECGAGEVCDELADVCGPACSTDEDGDGAVSMACGGDDCDDSDAENYPGNAELCDGEDNDCNGQIDAEVCLGLSCGTLPEPLPPSILPICSAATQAAARACPANIPCIDAALRADPSDTCGPCGLWQATVCASRNGCAAEFAAFSCCSEMRGCASATDEACVTMNCSEPLAQLAVCSVTITPECWDPDFSYFRQCFP